MSERYTVRIHTTHATEDSQVVTLESEHALLAAVEGLEQLAVPSLEHIASIQIEPADRSESNNRPA